MTVNGIDFDKRLCTVSAIAGAARPGQLPGRPHAGRFGAGPFVLPDGSPAVVLLGTCEDRWALLAVTCDDARALAAAFTPLTSLLPRERLHARVLGPADAALRVPQVTAAVADGIAVLHAGLAYAFADDDAAVLVAALTVAAHEAPRFTARIA